MKNRIPSSCRASDAAPRLVDELGRRRTLARGAAAFMRLRDGATLESQHGSADAPLLVLGLGPDAAAVDMLAGRAGTHAVQWLECPAFAAALDAQSPGWRERIPPHWREIAPEGIGTAARGAEVWLYRQNERLFPSFWGPLLGQVRAALLGAAGAAPPAVVRAVILPGGAEDLLHRELAEAFAAAGYAVRVPADAADLHRMLREARPALYFSVNGRGLDAGGADFALLRACGVPVALWFVDNPWHILSGLRLPWWRDAELFVTDASFMEGLRACGARQVRHLPLAYSTVMAARGAAAVVGDGGSGTGGAPSAVARGADGGVVFVGRSAFPRRDAFFAAAQVTAEDTQASYALLEADGRPDFHWWARRTQAELWPGHAVRGVGLGAERSAAAQRVRWLRAALPCGLTVYGDPQGWQQLLPEAPPEIFHSAVDYYTTLPGIYAAAPYSLNVTSLLLPAGLTQRHFDVWAAGGFLLTDPAPGLEIFPQELTREIAVPRAGDLPAAVQRLERDASLRDHLRHAWRAHILDRHGYAQRVAAVLDAVL